MPYNMLLADDLRAAMGVRLEGNVVVFDEAHNLVEVSSQCYYY
jgi:chromosome transmission fidelity protein 1